MKHILITRKSLFLVIVHVLVVNYYLYCISASKPIHGPASHCARHSTNMTQKDDPYVGLGPNQPLPRIILNEPCMKLRDFTTAADKELIYLGYCMVSISTDASQM